MMRACIELHKVVEAKIYILQLEDRFGYVIVFSPPFKKIKLKPQKYNKQTTKQTTNKQTKQQTNKQNTNKNPSF